MILPDGHETSRPEPRPEFHVVSIGSENYHDLSVRPGVVRVFLGVNGVKATAAARSAYDAREHWSDRFEMDRAVVEPAVVDERKQELDRYETSVISALVQVGK